MSFQPTGARSRLGIYSAHRTAQSTPFGARRHTATACAFLDRTGLRDAVVGEFLLPVNGLHRQANTLLWRRHAIFVRERAEHPSNELGMAPELLRMRQRSLRAFKASGLMKDAELIEGRGLEQAVAR